MRIVFTDHASSDYTYWQAADRKVLKRVNALIDVICGDDPFNGIGKPEMLRANLSGLWSRRITDEHRLVYFVQGDDLVLVTARYHYDRT